MKTILSVATLLAFAMIQLHAGPQDLVKERAKDLRDQNNARQGVPGTPPPSSTPPPVATTVKSAPVKPTPAAKIKTNLMGWQTKKSVDAELKKEFAGDLLAAARGSRKPSAENLDKFTESLASAISGKPLESRELSRLAQNINLAVNCAGLSTERTDEVATEVQTDLESAGATPEAAAAAATNLKAVMADLNP